MSPIVAALILEFFTPTKYVLSMNILFFQSYRISNPIPTVGTTGWIYSCRGMSITYWRVYHWISIYNTEIASPIRVKLKMEKYWMKWPLNCNFYFPSQNTLFIIFVDTSFRLSSSKSSSPPPGSTSLMLYMFCWLNLSGINKSGVIDDDTLAISLDYDKNQCWISTVAAVYLWAWKWQVFYFKNELFWRCERWPNKANWKYVTTNSDVFDLKCFCSH